MKDGFFTRAALVAFLLTGETLAHPGQAWARKLREIQERAAAPISSPEDSFEMIGDLVTPGPVTPMGQVRFQSHKAKFLTQ
jgi:hypothetical protein